MGSAWNEIKRLHRETTLGAKEGLAFRFFSRPLASTILYFIRNSRITPNQVTIASLIVGLAGSAVQACLLTWTGLLLGSALFMIAHMLDALDGQLARHRKAGSVIGMYFDFFIDELKAYFVYLAIAVRLFRLALQDRTVGFLDPVVEDFGVSSLLLASLAGIVGLAIGISCTQFVKRAEWKEAFPPGEPGGSPSLVARLVGWAESAGRFVIDYPSYILLVCLVNHVEIYFALYTLVVCVYAFRALLQISSRLWRVNPYAD